MSFSNLLTNDFLDHPKASENFFYFYTFDFYTFKNYTFESVVVSAHARKIDNLFVINHIELKRYLGIFHTEFLIYCVFF